MLRCGQKRLQGDGDINFLTQDRRCAAQGTGCNLRILVADCLHDIGGHQIVLDQFFRLQPDPDGVGGSERGDTADAIKATDRVIHVGPDIVAEVCLVERFAR